MVGNLCTYVLLHKSTIIIHCVITGVPVQCVPHETKVEVTASVAQVNVIKINTTKPLIIMMKASKTQLPPVATNPQTHYVNVYVIIF